MRITSEDLRESKLFMHYRIVMKWASAHYKISVSDVQLIMSLHCKKRFYNDGFRDSEATLSWDKKRFYRFKREGWVDVYRNFSKSHGEKTIYKVTRKANEMVNKIYRILLGEESIIFSKKNPFHKNETYTDKFMQTAIHKMNDNYQSDKSVY